MCASEMCQIESEGEFQIVYSESGESVEDASLFVSDKTLSLSFKNTLRPALDSDNYSIAAAGGQRAARSCWLTSDGPNG